MFVVFTSECVPVYQWQHSEYEYHRDHGPEANNSTHWTPKRTLADDHRNNAH